MTEETTHTAATDATLAIACSLEEEELILRSQELARDLFDFAERIDELADGYTWRFPGEGAWHATLLDFISTERRCCAFFRIELVFEPNLGPLTLTLRGPDGTKAFIRDRFGSS